MRYVVLPSSKNPGIANGLTYEAENPNITIGSAVRIPLRNKLVEGIVLEVPEPFMASAKFPVIVDPWIQLGGSASGYGVSQSQDREAFNPSVAVDSKGRPVVAWTESNQIAPQAGKLPGKGYIYLKRWNGSQWVELAGSASATGLTGKGLSSSPSLKLDSKDNPVVAWSNTNPDAGGETDIYLMRWKRVSRQLRELRQLILICEIGAIGGLLSRSGLLHHARQRARHCPDSGRLAGFRRACGRNGRYRKAGRCGVDRIGRELYCPGTGARQLLGLLLSHSINR